MKRILQLITKSALLAVGILMLTGAASFAQSSVVVDPGLNTIQAAMAANPGDTLILQKGKEYVVSEAVEITQPTVIMGEAYDREGSGDPPAVMRGSTDPGEEDDFYMILAAADVRLIDIGFIGFTWDNRQIAGALAASAGNINVEASGCILQGVSKCWVTNSFAGINWVLHDNIHWNISTTGWDNYAGWGGPAYGGDSSTNHTYNCSYFVGGKINLSGSTGPTGWQWGDHNTYVCTWGESFHKSKMDGFKVQNSIFYNTHLRGYVGPREWIDGTDTLVWGGDYVSYRQLGDTLNGDCAVFPHDLDSVESDLRFVIITNNLKYNEQQVLDWHQANGVTTQPFLAWAMRTRAAENGWTIEPNWTPDTVNSNSYDPLFEMGPIPAEVFESSWAQRIDRMDPEIPDHEVAWRPDSAEQKDFIWPLPFDFTPTAEELMDAATDGYPLGDLNWFGPEMVAAWEAGQAVGIEENKPVELSLMNYPNPFNSTTRIQYNLPARSHVNMKIFNVTGALMANLVNETQIAGHHEIMFDGSELSRGIYFCQIRAGKDFQVHKMILIK